MIILIEVIMIEYLFVMRGGLMAISSSNSESALKKWKAEIQS